MAFTGTGYDGTVGETELSQILDAVADHGVIGDYNGSAFSAAKVIGSRTMAVQPGFILAPGVIGHLDATANATPADAPSPALSGSQQRIDLLVAKFDWGGTGGTCSLVMKKGSPSATPSPPSVVQTPGVVFEIPLRQGLLTAAVQGEYTTTSMVDRRYWIEGGKYVLPNATQLPPGRTGAMAWRPDVQQLLVHNGASWSTFKAMSDTGWQAIANPYPGFTGSTWGRILNGQATLLFPWTKGPAGMTNQNVVIQLPTAYAPSFDGVMGTLRAGAPVSPVAATLGTDAKVSLDSVTLNASATLRGSFSYPVG
jgi:hypothetical protein